MILGMDISQDIKIKTRSKKLSFKAGRRLFYKLPATQTWGSEYDPQDPWKKARCGGTQLQSQCGRHWPPQRTMRIIPKEWHLRLTSGFLMCAQTWKRAPPCASTYTCRSTHTELSFLYLFLYCVMNLLFV